MQTTTRKLLVLDLDETLIYAAEDPLEREPDFRVGRYFVYRRPHLEGLLEACFERFEVAVWTSASPDYAAEVVEAIFPEPDRPAFVWAADRCTRFFHAEHLAYYWLKSLRKLTRRGYRAENIIAVDDSPEKWSRSYGNLVRVRPFYGKPDDELLLLRRYLERLGNAENVRAVEKRYWHTELGEG